MNRNQTSSSTSPITIQESNGEKASSPRTEDLLIRNHDQLWGYDLNVKAVHVDDDITFSNRYYLQPGQIEYEIGEIPRGTYDVGVVLDNNKIRFARCTIDPPTGRAILIELGNGAVSITDDLLDR